MEIIHISETRRFSRDRANRFGLLDRPRLVCDLVCLEPGQHEPRREYPTSDELYYVIEGKAKVRVGVHEYDIEAEQVLLVPPKLQHWIANPGPGRMTALAIVTPKPGRESEIRPPRAGPPSRGKPRPGGREARGRREERRPAGRGRPEREGRGERGAPPRAGPGIRPARTRSAAESEGRQGPTPRAGGQRARPQARGGQPRSSRGRRPRS